MNLLRAMRFVAVGTLLSLASPAQLQFCDPACDAPAGCDPLCEDIRATSCHAMIVGAIDCLNELGQSTGNCDWCDLAEKLEDALNDGKILLCQTLDGFMETGADCQSSTAWYYCPGNNCNCIYITAENFDQDCIYGYTNDVTGESFETNIEITKWILAAALAHEMCHAETLAACRNKSTGQWLPLCNLLCNERACASIERDILFCVLTKIRPIPIEHIDYRYQFIKTFIENMNAQIAANNCNCG